MRPPTDGRSSGNPMSNPISKIRGSPKDFGGSGGASAAVKMNPAGVGTGAGGANIAAREEDDDLR